MTSLELIQKKMRARRLGKISTLAIVCALAACITVNVNFPESAVQRAADDFVRDLYQSSQSASNTSKDFKRPKAKKASKENEKGHETEKSEPTTLHFSLGFTEAYAQEINMNTARAQSIKDRMRGRVGAIANAKSRGVVCETKDALLSIRDASKAGGDVAGLVQAENADRDALYEEIQNANSITDRKQTKIRRIFAASFRANSPAGTCIENEDGSWGTK